MDIFLYILAGATVGLAIGITGVGGGSIMTPLLISFGFPYNIAIGTDLLYAAITKAGGVLSHSRQKSVNWPIVMTLAAGSIPASLVTTFILTRLFDHADDYSSLLTTSLGVMLIMTSLVLIFRARLQPLPRPTGSTGPQTIKAGWLTILIGAALGVLVTLSSVGAGAICAALLMVVYPRLPALQVVGTDIAHAVPLTLVAGLGHLIFLGNVDLALLTCLLVGSLPAIHLGSRVGAKLPNRVLQPVLACLLMGIGVKFALF